MYFGLLVFFQRARRNKISPFFVSGCDKSRYIGRPCVFSASLCDELGACHHGIGEEILPDTL